MDYSNSDARTKIVATVGPACDGEEQLAALVEAGVNVFRVNTAHGTREEHQGVVNRIRSVEKKLLRPIGILLDLAGPKIRLGELVEDPTECREGERFELVRGDKAASRTELTSNYPPLIDELDVGDPVMLADGTVGMQVVEKTADRVTCEVVTPGTIRSRQGINLPGVKLSVPAMTERDLDNADWAATQPIDFVSLSFVRTAQEVLELKQMLRQKGSMALVVAKIEKREALDDLDDIVASADGVMVARGDLGVEIDVAETPVAQKKIVAKCQQYLKPVIVATQMLDSMQHSRRPTRAEVTDVANAILDGADACMLSGETAIGKYPLDTVKMMNRIMLTTEASLHDQPASEPPVPAVAGVHPITSAVVYGAARIAAQLFARLVAIVTRSGATARVKAKQREFIPTIGLSDSENTLRQMCLFWGIFPVYASADSVKSGPDLRNYVDEWAKERSLVSTGDRIVFVTGSQLVAQAHNLVVVHEVE